MVHGDDHGLAGTDFPLDPVKHEYSFALHDGPGFGPVAVDLVGDVLPCIDGEALGQRMPAVGIGRVVDDPVGAPPSLLVHRPRSEMVDGLLDVLGVFLPADDDPVRAGGDDCVLHPVDIDRVLQFVDDVGVGAARAHHGVADDVMVKLVSEGVPGAEVLPLT